MLGDVFRLRMMAEIGEETFGIGGVAGGGLQVGDEVLPESIELVH